MHATCHPYTYFTYESLRKPLRSTQKMLAEAAKHPCNETLVFCAEKRHHHAVFHGDNAATYAQTHVFHNGKWHQRAVFYDENDAMVPSQPGQGRDLANPGDFETLSL